MSKTIFATLVYRTEKAATTGMQSRSRHLAAFQSINEAFSTAARDEGLDPTIKNPALRPIVWQAAIDLAQAAKLTSPDDFKEVFNREMRKYFNKK